jgi:predicted MPP superfamily phosphohydrolase
VSASLDAWALLLPLAVCAISLAWTHKPPRITTLRVVVAALPRPLRVVHLSDLHVGPYVGDTRLTWLAEAVAAAEPDVVCITGDFLTERTQRDWSAVLRFAARLHAPRGVYACLGNHDVAVAGALSASLGRCGVHVLRDEIAWLGTGDDGPAIAVAGLDWRSGRAARNGYAEAFATLADAAGDSGPAIVLCHHPAAFDLAPQGFAGLMLAGHLHGGQIGVTWGARGVSILRLFGMYDQGLFVRGPAQLYSHRGTGVYGFPLRIGVPAEISVLDLVPPHQTRAIPLQA